MSEMENYKMIRPLGEGAFGKVTSQHILTGKYVAVKSIKIKKAKKQNLYKNIRREIKILKIFNHPNIIKLYDLTKSEKNVYLILEYVSGGELYNTLEREGRFDESRARIIFIQIAEAIEYSHSKKVSHRDLKLENILMAEFEKPKLSDFGLSNFMKDGQFLKTFCGSSNYAAPELISNRSYCGSEIDVWSLGVILYALVTGSLPFDELTLPALYYKIKNGIYRTPYHISPALAALISGCLQVNLFNRMTIHEVLLHPWVRTFPLIIVPKLKSSKMRKINEKVFENLLEKKTFCGLVNEKEKLKERILKQDGFDLFTTSYELLVDSKEYSQNALVLEKKVFDCKFYYKEGQKPSDWKFGLWTGLSSEEVIQRLFTVLVDCRLEWRILEKFWIRIRTVGMGKRVRMGESCNLTGVKKDLKFEILVFKEDEKFGIDFRIVFGHVLVFFDVVDRIRKGFVMQHLNFSV